MDRMTQNTTTSGRIARVATCAVALAALLAGTWCTPAQAGSDGRKGTAGAGELLIPVGPRGSALGDAVAGDVTGLEAMFYNPAGLAGGEGTAVAFSHADYFAGMKVTYAAGAMPVGGLGVLGLSAKVLSVGEVIVTTEASPDGTGEVLTPTFTVLGMTWAKAFTDRVNFGGTVSYVNENVANNIANGVGFDFGMQYATGWRGLRFGMAMKNVGTQMRYSGPGLEIFTRDPLADPNAGSRGLSFSSAGFEMPSFFSFASSYEAYKDPNARLTVMAAYQNNNFNGDNVRAGAEWAYKESFMLRGALFGTFNGTIDPLTGEESFKLHAGDDLYTGVALGAGFATKVGDQGQLGVDLSWRPVREYFDDIVEMGLRFRF
jgi:hypothetical protein